MDNLAKLLFVKQLITSMFHAKCRHPSRESVLSLLPAAEYETVVEHIEDLTYDIKLIRCRLLGEQEIAFKPGQYAQLRVPGIDVIRTYSIASNPKDKDFFALIIRMVHKVLGSGAFGVMTAL